MSRDRRALDGGGARLGLGEVITRQTDAGRGGRDAVAAVRLAVVRTGATLGAVRGAAIGQTTVLTPPVDPGTPVARG